MASNAATSQNNGAGFGVRNFLRETLAARPVFLDSIKARGQDTRVGNTSVAGAIGTPSGGSAIKQRANSLLPGDTELIDQKSLFDADNVIAEVDFFVNRLQEDRPQRNSMLEKLKKLSRTGVTGAKGNPGVTQYSLLLQRLTGAESKLKEVVNDAVAQESSFTMQALHLTIRVASCIKFNKDTLPVLKEELAEALRIESELENWTRLILSMKKFQTELQAVHDMQYRFVPASMRPKPSPAEVKQQEETKADLQSKLNKIEKLTKKIKRKVAQLTRLKNERELNYSNLVYSNNVLLGMLNRQGYGEEEIREQIWLREIRKEGHAAHRRKSAALSKIPVQESEESEPSLEIGNGEELVDNTVVYDHNQCSDCGCVHTMVTECVMQLAAKTLQAEEGTRRLQRVLELQVRMNDVKSLADEMD